MISQSALARAWGVSQPAISKLVGRGMPLTSAEDAAAWKALNDQRKGRAAATVAPAPKRKAKIPARPGKSAPVVVASNEVGAEHALKRLAQAEYDSAARVAELIARITEPGDDDNVIQLAALLTKERESWLKISESLRKFDLLIEESRRDSGQLIPRAESEIACELAAMWLRLAVRTFIGSYVDRIVKAGGDHAAIVRLIEDGMEAGVNTSMLRCTGCRVPLQPWAIAAVRRGYGLGADAPLPAASSTEGDDDAG